MKAVILLAGKGKRLGSITKNRNKAMIELQGRPLIGHLIERLVFCGLTDIIPVLGYDSKRLLQYIQKNFAHSIDIIPSYNPKYEETNNLYSLSCAKKLIAGKEFLLCNGDLLLNKFIIKGLLSKKGVSSIAIDDSPRIALIDSPGTITYNNRIYDLGRHIPFGRSSGYAIGLYRFNKTLSSAFFREADKMLKDNLDAGFHDPLKRLFKQYHIFAHSTLGLSWTDIDKKEDILHAESVLRKILKEEGIIKASSGGINDDIS